MTNEEAKKMLKAKLECFKNETSGINHDCNMRLCDGCSLNYEQGNMGEQKEALDKAIKALEQTRWIPVSERYPKIEDEYKYFIVTDDKGKVSVQEFFISLDEEPQPYFSGMVNVIAWMPLPQPYEESEDEE